MYVHVRVCICVYVLASDSVRVSVLLGCQLVYICMSVCMSVCIVL